MINEEWTVYPPEKTEKFVQDVRGSGLGAFFEGSSFELWAYELDFFEGYSRYSLNNTSVVPYVSLDYISNGEDHYYLDGSAQPVMLLAARGALRLTRENVLAYLDFFDDVAFDSERKVKFIVDAYDTGYAGAQAMGHHFKAMEYTARRTIAEHEDHFLLEIPALFNGQTVQARVRVGKDGQIEILSPVPAMLTVSDGSANPLRYPHPAGAELLAANAEILDRSPLGRLMLDFAEAYGVNVTICAGITQKRFMGSARSCLLFAPATVRQPSPYQVIDLAGALREAEIAHLPDDDAAADEEIDFLERQHGRNLDVLLTLCRIVRELEGHEYGEAVRCFRKMGLGDLYAGYLRDLPPEQLMDIYAEIYS